MPGMGMSKVQIVLLLVTALTLGIVGAACTNMYLRHNAQHATVEQMMRQQEQINREFAQAINSLAQRK